MIDAMTLAAKRTPIWQLGGELSNLSASELGAQVVHSLLEEVKLDPGEIDDV